MQKRAGFEAFAHATSLLRTAWLLTGSRADAEDLLQEALTRLWVKWPKVSEASNQLAYGRTTLVRVHASGRRLKRSTERPVAEVGDSPAVSDDPDDRVVLAAALGRLGPVDRAVVVLRHHDGRPAPEVAEILGISPGAVRKRSARALAQLRELLPDEREIHGR
jgi:RNA polymerase sigma-70 factor (sigma-E family)